MSTDLERLAWASWGILMKDKKLIKCINCRQLIDLDEKGVGSTNNRDYCIYSGRKVPRWVQVMGDYCEGYLRIWWKFWAAR